MISKASVNLQTVGFSERARHYRALDVEWASFTTFFAAAAAVNELLHWLSKLQALNGGTLQLMEGLGAALLETNDSMAIRFSCRPPKLHPELLTRVLIQSEQRAAELHLRNWRAKDRHTYDSACQRIDRLLAHPVLQIPFLGRISLLRPYARLSRQKLQFDNWHDRVTIGFSLANLLNSAAPNLDASKPISRLC